MRFWIIFNKVPVYEAIDSYFVWGNRDIAEECYGKFVKSKYLTNKKNGEKRAVAANELLLGQTADTNIVKNLKNIDIGTKA